MAISKRCFNSENSSMQRNLLTARPVWSGGMTAIALTTLLLQPSALASPEALTEQEVIDQVFLTDTPLPGADRDAHEELLAIRDDAVAWLGNYQGVRTEADYLVIEFENGEVPVTVAFKDDGELDVIGTQCPITAVPLSQAPAEFQAALAVCPDLEP
ncbi:MAG: hypothetical protein AAF282_16020 [Cyanobacteria bacterium P01_A01_bin.15]